jgi:hypothetical protein
MFEFLHLHVQSRAERPENPLASKEQRLGSPVDFSCGSGVLQQFHNNILQPPEEETAEIERRIPL